MTKFIFKAKETIFQGVKGFELSQVQNEKIVCVKFIEKNSFRDFIQEAGIDPEQIEYI